MKKYFLLAVFFLGASFLHAQIYEQTVVHAGDELTAYFTYRFPSFEEATVKFKDGRTLVSRMNFNMLLCIIQFINPNGDTLELLKTDEIDSIRIDKSSFYYNNGSYEVIAASDSVKLVAFRKVSFEPVTVGAMGQPAHGTSTDSYSSFMTNTTAGSTQLTLNEDIYVKKQTIYYLINNKGELFTATKPNFLRQFENKKKAVEGFLKSNKTNFNRQTDLEKLFHFCIAPVK